MKKRKVICQYCQQEAVFMTTEEFYGRDYGTNMWVCRPCDAYVGIHKRTDVPLGTLANKELRECRKKTHAVVDQLWRNKKSSRTKVYGWIQHVMKMTKEEAHIGMMNEAQCKQLIEFAEQRQQA
jgi:hypothetical protein